MFRWDKLNKKKTKIFIGDQVWVVPFKFQFLVKPIGRLTSRMGFNCEIEVVTLVWNWFYVMEWDESLKGKVHHSLVGWVGF